jgi:hypothetical protein
VQTPVFALVLISLFNSVIARRSSADGYVFTALKAADYRGWFVVQAEQDPANAPPLVYARRGFVDLLRETGW